VCYQCKYCAQYAICFIFWIKCARWEKKSSVSQSWHSISLGRAILVILLDWSEKQAVTHIHFNPISSPSTSLFLKISYHSNSSYRYNFSLFLNAPRPCSFGSSYEKFDSDVVVQQHQVCLQCLILVCMT